MLCDVVKRTLLNNINTIEEEYRAQEIEDIQSCDWDALEKLFRKGNLPFEPIIIYQDNDKKTFYYLKGITVFGTIDYSQLDVTETRSYEHNKERELVLLENLSLVAFEYEYRDEQILINNKLVESLRITRKRLKDISFTTKVVNSTIEVFDEILDTLQNKM